MSTKIVTVTVRVDRQETPEVTPRKRTDHRRCVSLRVTFIKYAALTVAGIVAFILLSRYSYGVRGYKAVGGEVFALLLPVLFYVASRTVRDFMDDFSKDGAERRNGRWSA